MTHHVLAYARLADVDAEFEQFAVDARRAPEWILPAQLADQFPSILRNRRPAGLAVADLPGPEQSEALPVPGDHGLWVDDHEGGPPVTPSPAQPSPEKPVHGGQLRSLLG